MRYKVCDARDLQPGHLGLMADRTGFNRPVFGVRLGEDRFLLMLPITTRDPRRDFRLRQINTGQKHKVLDLGMDFVFDFDPQIAALNNNELHLSLGSLVFVGQDVGLMSVRPESEPYPGSEIIVLITQGQFWASERDEMCEVTSWRLLLPSDLPLEPPRVLADWPGKQDDAARSS